MPSHLEPPGLTSAPASDVTLHDSASYAAERDRLLRRIQLLQSQISDIVLTLDTDGSFTERLLPDASKLSRYFENTVNLRDISFIGIDRETVADYIELFFDTRRSIETLQAINPLKKVQIAAEGLESKFLRFSFARYAEGGREQAVITVRDITELLRSEERLELERIEHERKTEILFKIIHVDAELLADFMESASSGIEAINSSLKRESTTAQQKLAQIARIAHSIKGNAGMLELDFFRREVHIFEEEIRRLQAMDAKDGAQFIQLLNLMQMLKKHLADMEVLIDKLSNFKVQTGSSVITEKTKLFNALRQLVQKVSEEEQKAVELDASAFPFESIPNRYLPVVREFLVQGIQNAIIHGIEKAEERRQYNKPDRATIRLQMANGDGSFVITIADDGRGLELEKLRRRAIEKGMSPQKVAQLPAAKLGSIIFLPGVSTAATTTERAGRGVGLDMLRESIRSHQGSLQVAFRERAGMKMTARLPSDI